MLVESPTRAGSINRLGVEIFCVDEVLEATAYLGERGLATEVEEQSTGSFAVRDKVWVDGPDGSRREVFTVLADAPGSPDLTARRGVLAARGGRPDGHDQLARRRARRPVHLGRLVEEIGVEVVGRLTLTCRPQWVKVMTNTSR